MSSTKKLSTITRAKSPVSSAAQLRKTKSPLAVNFSVKEGANLNNSEISIKVNGREIIAQFYVGGELVSTQAVPVKKIPNPPPMPHDELFQILQNLRLYFNIQR